MANSSNASILDDLNVQQLPALLPGSSDLIDSMLDDELELDDLVSIIEKFPPIVGRLISLANSAWSAPIEIITSLETACMRLGSNVVKNTSIALAIAKPFDPTRCPNFDKSLFWCTAMLSADLAVMLARISPSKTSPEPAAARTAGLLHNLGLLWLVDALPDQVSSAIQMAAQEDSQGLGQALRQLLNFDHTQAGGLLARHWDLPEALVAPIEHHRDARFAGPHEAIVITVGLAEKLVTALIKNQTCPSLDERAQRLGLNEKQLVEAFQQTEQDLVKTRELADKLFNH